MGLIVKRRFPDCDAEHTGNFDVARDDRPRIPRKVKMGGINAGQPLRRRYERVFTLGMGVVHHVTAEARQLAFCEWGGGVGASRPQPLLAAARPPSGRSGCTPGNGWPFPWKGISMKVKNPLLMTVAAAGLSAFALAGCEQRVEVEAEPDDAELEVEHEHDYDGDADVDIEIEDD